MILLPVERIKSVGYADSHAVKTWRDPARVQAINALSLASDPDFYVIGVRNSKGTLLGIAACFMGDRCINLAHIAARDYGTGIGKLLVEYLAEYAGKLPIKARVEKQAEGFYEAVGWRKVGAEYWSK